MDKVAFVQQYMDYVNASGFIPNNYCTVPYLISRKDLEPYEDNLGRVGIREKGSKYFFLPPYSKKGDDVVFYNGSAIVNFPEQEVKVNKGYRYDTEYYYHSSNSLKIISSDRDTYVNAKKEHESFSLPFSNHDYDDKLWDYYADIMKRGRSRRLMEPNFENFLFNDYGQHRFVLMYKEEILAVLLWSENGSFINVHYIYGRTSNKDSYADKHYRKYCFFYAARVLAYDFMKRFPIGTYLNMGGPGYDQFLKKTLEASRPCNIIEVKSCIPRKPEVKIGRSVYKLVGKTVEEEWKTIGSRKTKPNRMLFNHLYAKKIYPKQISKEVLKRLKYIRSRKVKRMYSNQKYIEKIKENLKNEA